MDGHEWRIRAAGKDTVTVVPSIGVVGMGEAGEKEEGASLTRPYS